MRSLKHIAVAGNIGAGKTTLTEMLARHYHWDVQFEDTTTNPYLADFYDDMHRWSFNLQIYFLNSRYDQVLKIRNGQKAVIQDRTIYEDARIFAPNLHEMGLMSSRDFDNYISLFGLMSSQVQPPDLLIYLKCSIPKLVEHIQTRGRDYEGSMSLEYLKKLNERYEEWISSYTHGNLLIIQNDNLDFKNNPEDFGLIIEQIDGHINGLF
ncbi:MAG TPA: deoxynucleoside kinase [Saprospiraceae bacterium]|nr:deoxynucleoside kinase [Saprospiraceae bacterium]HRO09468.1 deoxynucleoside kinase [Saprospiraceae bacterium]